MVKISSAIVRLDYTGGILLEDSLVSLDSSGNWSILDGCINIFTFAIIWDIGETSNFTDSLLGVKLAEVPEMVRCMVRIVRFKHERMFLDVFESVVHDTTVAGMVSFVTVEELLLREGLECAGLNGFSTLNGTGGGESPA